VTLEQCTFVRGNAVQVDLDLSDDPPRAIVSLCRCEVRDDGEFTVAPMGGLEDSSGDALVGIAAHAF
jgi:hypothetical protein